MIKRIPILLSPLAVWAGFPLQAETPDALLNHQLEEIRNRYDVVGLSALAMRAGETIWQGGFGQADLARNLPVTPETRFRIASISKTITAAALMRLWEQGRFQLDDDIGPHLGFPVVHPRFPDTPVTFRQLLNHTSSLRDGPNYNRFLMDCYRAGENAPALKAILHPEGGYYSDGVNFANHRPGGDYAYSNLNYAVIGTLVEALSGERFDVHCRKHVLQPLGIKGGFNPAHLHEIDSLAVLYQQNEHGLEAVFDNHGGVIPADHIGTNYRPGHNAIVFSPQGGLRMNTVELGSWMKMFMERADNRPDAVLQPATMDLMLAEHWSNGRQDGEYRGRGLCFQRTVNVVPGELWVGHGGRAYGLLAKMYFQEEGDIGMLYVTSGSKPGEVEAELHPMEREIFQALRDRIKAAGPN